MLRETRRADLEAMPQAFKRIGWKTPLDAAAALLEQCHQEHPEDPVRCLQIFAAKMRQENPMLAAILDEHKSGLRFDDVVRMFVHRHARWWRFFARSMTRSRGLRNRMAQTPFQQNNARHYTKANNRRKRGVVLVRAEVDLKTGELELVGKLPMELRLLEINAQRMLLLDLTGEQAAIWCERHARYAGVGAKWAAMCTDPRKTLRENLTPEIVTELNRLMAA